MLISETGDFQPAIQTIYRTPGIERVHIEHSRQIGFEFLLPKQSILFGYSRVTNALEKAVNGLVYYGQSTDEKSTFDLLHEQSIHGQPFSLLNLCNAHRIVPVKYRLITFYKYEPTYRTCSKLFCSNNPYKIGIRFFQVRTRNTFSEFTWKLNSLSILLGESTQQYLSEWLDWNSSRDQRCRWTGTQRTIELFNQWFERGGMEIFVHSRQRLLASNNPCIQWPVNRRLHGRDHSLSYYSSL